MLHRSSLSVPETLCFGELQCSLKIARVENDIVIFKQVIDFRKNIAKVVFKTGRFDNIDSAALHHWYIDSWIYAVEASSFKNYCDFILPL